MATPSSKLQKTKNEYLKKYRKNNKQATVIYNPTDYKQIVQNAKNSGLSVSEFIRETSMKRKISPIDLNIKYRSEYKAEIRKIGVNVNQIAKALNQHYVEQDLTIVLKQLQLVDNNLRLLIGFFK